MPRVQEYSLSSVISIFGFMDICSRESRSVFFIIHDCSGARSCLSGRVWGEKNFHPTPPPSQQSIPQGKRWTRGESNPGPLPGLDSKHCCTCEMLREYYTTKPRARGSSCYSFDEDGLRIWLIGTCHCTRIPLQHTRQRCENTFDGTSHLY